jgi:hypothetical protein
LVWTSAESRLKVAVILAFFFPWNHEQDDERSVNARTDSRAIRQCFITVFLRRYRALARVF